MSVHFIRRGRRYALNEQSTASSINPASYTSLVLWFKADSFSLATNTAISSWTDLSSYGNTATQATSGKQPTYQTGIFGSMPGIRFTSASSQLMTLNTQLTLVNLTALVVFEAISPSSVSVLGSATAGLGLNIAFNGVNNIYIADGNGNHQSNTFSTALSAAKMGTGIKQGSAMSFYENSTSQGTSTGASSAFTVGEIGATQTSFYLNGWIAEIAVFNTALASTDVSSLYTSYFKPRWSLP